MSSHKTPFIHDVQHDFIQDGDRVTKKATQHITDSFITDLRDQRYTSHDNRAIGDNMRVASIPVAIHERWLKQDGFDLFKEPHKKVVAKLKAEGLDAFIATTKQL